MENIKIKLKGDILTLEVDMSKNLGPSFTGKSDIVATSKGAIFIKELEEYGFKMSLSVFKLDPMKYKKRGYKEYTTKNPKAVIKKRARIQKDN